MPSTTRRTVLYTVIFCHCTCCKEGDCRTEVSNIHNITARTTCLTLVKSLYALSSRPTPVARLHPAPSPALEYRDAQVRNLEVTFGKRLAWPAASLSVGVLNRRPAEVSSQRVLRVSVCNEPCLPTKGASVRRKFASAVALRLSAPCKLFSLVRRHRGRCA